MSCRTSWYKYSLLGPTTEENDAVCFFSSGKPCIKTSFSHQHSRRFYIFLYLSPYPKNFFLPNNAVSSRSLGKKERGTEVSACETKESSLIFTWHLRYCVAILRVRNKMKWLPAKLRIVHVRRQYFWKCNQIFGLLLISFINYLFILMQHPLNGTWDCNRN